MLDNFKLNGTVISEKQHPMNHMRIEAYDDDPILNPDDLLGQVYTDERGFFNMDFDQSKFIKLWEFLEGTPDVYLILRDNAGKKILTTKVAQTRKEIEYHIRVVENLPEPDAKDPYSGNARRLISMLNEVGEQIGMENRINLDILENGDLPQTIKDNLQTFANGHDDRQNNFNQFMVILSSLVDLFLEESHFGSIGYDGPQVPRMARRQSYDQVIIWPRKEKFRWE